MWACLCMDMHMWVLVPMAARSVSVQVLESYGSLGAGCVCSEPNIGTLQTPHMISQLSSPQYLCFKGAAQGFLKKNQDQKWKNCHF